MSISVTCVSTHRVLLSTAFYLARRPVVDRSLDLAAWELLFFDAGVDPAGTDEPLAAAPSVIADVCEYGLGRVLGDAQGVLYVDGAALSGDMFGFLPPDRLVFVLDAAQAAAPGIAQRILELRGRGFRFALAVRDADVRAEAQLSLFDGVRIDVSGMDRARLAPLCRTYAAAGKRLLAECVNSRQAHALCVELGVDYFQGTFFAAPQAGPHQPLAPMAAAIAQLMSLIASDADSAEIEHRLKSDVALGLCVLRMANAPAFGHHRIESLRQALMVVGRDQLQRWLQLMLYADAARRQAQALPLLAMAAGRARLMELVAQKLKPGNRGIADSAFTVGLMSLMDALFSRPLPALLDEMPVSEDVATALIARAGYLGQLLALATATEWSGGMPVRLPSLLAELKLDSHTLYGLQLAAFEWSDEVVRHARSLPATP
ncbi:MAG TPA: HDOD domain-containing protein [Noviherbaspirillum sp.]|nr:HDOD domain-containing protein [Noviherbaspirillum sp.]